MRYCSMPQRLGQIKTNKSNQCWRGCGKNGIDSAFLENHMDVPKKKKLRTQLTQQPCFLKYTPRALKQKQRKDIYTPVSLAALPTIAQICKQPKCPRIDY